VKKPLNEMTLGFSQNFALRFLAKAYYFGNKRPLVKTNGNSNSYILFTQRAKKWISLIIKAQPHYNIQNQEV
jgi:hypothetical protein